MIRETTSRGRCELVCPSRTNERGGEGFCVKEGEGEEGERERERALGLLLCHIPRHSDIEVDPQHSSFGRIESETFTPERSHIPRGAPSPGSG